MADLRVVVELNAGAPRTPAQWLNLMTAAKNKPLVLEIRNKGDIRNLPQRKFNANRQSVEGVNFQYMIADFEVDTDDIAGIDTLVTSELTRRALATTGSRTVKFVRLLQVELREAGTDLGFSAAITNTFIVRIIGIGDRDAAIVAAQADINTNSARWSNGAI